MGREPWEQTSSLYFVSQTLLYPSSALFLFFSFYIQSCLLERSACGRYANGTRRCLHPCWDQDISSRKPGGLSPPRSGGRETRSKKIEGLRIRPLLGCCVLRMSPFLVLSNFWFQRLPCAPTFPCVTNIRLQEAESRWLVNWRAQLPGGVMPNTHLLSFLPCSG